MLSVVDQSGRIILAKSVEGKGSIDVSKLPAGIYYLKNTETGEIQKIVVSK